MHENVISVIEEWVDEWIVKENFCPFARPTRVQDSLRITVCDSDSWSDVYETLFVECKRLEKDDNIATTLIVLTQATEDYFEYLSLLEGAEQLIDNERWRGTFQLASFHPNYLFEGEAESSPTHFTNRSPLPMLHILREEHVTRMIPSQKEADDIVERNQSRLEIIGADAASKKLNAWIQRIRS